MSRKSKKKQKKDQKIRYSKVVKLCVKDLDYRTSEQGLNEGFFYPLFKQIEESEKKAPCV